MAIDVLDRIGQKVAKEEKTGFVIEPAGIVIQPKTPQVLEFDEQSATVSGVFLDTAYWYLLRWYDISLTANSLGVIWQRQEEVSAVSPEPSEEELLDSWSRYLEEHWDELVAGYKGKYVAIWDDRVYDSDEDIGALAERVYGALGYRPIFMPHIGEKHQVQEFISSI